MNRETKIASEACNLLRDLYAVLENSDLVEKVATAAIMYELSPVLNIANVAEALDEYKQNS